MEEFKSFCFNNQYSIEYDDEQFSIRQDNQDNELGYDAVVFSFDQIDFLITQLTRLKEIV